MMTKNDLIDYFYRGIKDKTELRIGVEHEKFVLDRKDFKPVSYEQKNGIKEIFLKCIKFGWTPIYDDKNSLVTGLKKENEFITLEPGGQLELSGAPLKNIHETCNETTKHLKEFKKIGEELGFILLGIGVEPFSKLEDFPWMPKQRYKIMKDYMPTVGNLGHHMMKRTCTNQVNLDFYSEEDMKNKFRIMLNLESIANAIFSNSPFDNGKLSKYKSLRSFFWQQTDLARTGLLPFVFEKNFNFERYAEYALDIPMYFIIRDHKYINMTKYTFRDFFEKKIILSSNIQPNIQDWINHLSTLFPQVRLKNYLEIRSMDACNWELICSQPAFWLGLIYDDDAMNEVNNIVEEWDNEDREYLNKLIPIHGLQTNFKNKKVIDYAQDFFQLSKNGLSKRRIMSSNNEFDETIHMKELENNLSKGFAPADNIINKFNTIWSKSVKPIYQELIF